MALATFGPTAQASAAIPPMTRSEIVSRAESALGPDVHLGQGELGARRAGRQRHRLLRSGAEVLGGAAQPPLPRRGLRRLRHQPSLHVLRVLQVPWPLDRALLPHVAQAGRHPRLQRRRLRARRHLRSRRQLELAHRVRGPGNRKDPPPGEPVPLVELPASPAQQSGRGHRPSSSTTRRRRASGARTWAATGPAPPRCRVTTAATSRSRLRPAAAAWARWTPRFSSSGNYDVYMRWTSATQPRERGPGDRVHTQRHACRAQSISASTAAPGI